MLTAFSIATLLAKVGGAKKAIGRFLNGNAGLALVVVAGIVAVMLFLVWLRSDAAETAVAGRDAAWKSRLAEAHAIAAKSELEAERRGSAAASAEKTRAERERDEALARAVVLEQQIAAAQAGKKLACDPRTELIPLAVVQAMRRGKGGRP